MVRFVGLMVTLQMVVGAWGQAVPCASVQPRDLIVNEILFDAPGALEFVEILNRSSCSIPLEGVTLSDSRGTRESVGNAGTIAAGALVVLVSDGTAFASAFPATPFVEVARWPALNNAGDAVVLHAAGQAVDSVFYQSVWGVPGRSIERRHPDRPSLAATSWGPSGDPEGGTPGRPNSLFAIDADPPRVTYAEEEPGNVVFVRLSEPALATSVTRERFRVDGRHPSAVEAGPSINEYRLLFEQRPLGVEMWTQGLVDLSGNTAPEERVQVAALARPGSLLLNEIMYEPPDLDGASVEYVEFYNAGNRAVSLRGLRLGDGPDAATGLRQTALVTDERISVSAGGFVVVFEGSGALPVGPAVPPELTFYDVVPADGTVWISLASVTPRGLANGGQEVAVVAVDGTIIDAVGYLPQWHSLTLRELGRTEGTALERRPGAGGNTGAAWTSSVARFGGTPGAHNSLTPLTDEQRAATGVDAFPSPFSPDDDGVDDVVAIRYRLRNEAALVRARVFDLDGREVRALEDATFSGPVGQLVWDGHDAAGRPMSTGVYVVVVEGIAAETADAERYRALVTVANGH